MTWEELCANLCVGLISGVISGLIVYFVSKRRERKYRVYAYWESFLFNALSRFGIGIPTEALECIADIGDRNSKWRKAMDSVMEVVYKPNIEDRVITDEEEQLSDNVMIAFDELSKWAKANKLGTKKRKG